MSAAHAAQNSNARRRCCLIGFGGPTRAEEIRPFLDNMLRGRPIPKERYEEVVHHYELLGGRSPYNELTMRPGRGAARASFGATDIDIPVVGRDAQLDAVSRGCDARAGRREALAASARIHSRGASMRGELGAISETRAMRRARRSARRQPQVEYPEPWHDHPQFIEAVAARAREAFARLEQSEAKRAELIFTAHSIPVAMARASGYVDQITRIGAAWSRRNSGIDRWPLAFQSRSGAPRDPWLEPDICEVDSRPR